VYIFTKDTYIRYQKQPIRITCCYLSNFITNSFLLSFFQAWDWDAGEIPNNGEQVYENIMEFFSASSLEFNIPLMNN